MRRPSAAAVRRATGRDWDEWFAVLDRCGAVRRSHGEIAAELAQTYGVGSWWSQAITVEYERARGLRAPGSGRDGQFQVTASKTVAVPVEQLFAAFVDADIRRRWLADAELRERTARPGRSVRFDCGAERSSRIAVGFTAKAAGRSQVALLHERLPDADAAQGARTYWREHLTALKALLEQ
jgi:uncharacterized protein YndB with AHSA1/START domain